MLPILVLQALSEYTRSDSKPPVTAALLVANVLIYLRWPPLLDRALPAIDEVWFNPYLVVKAAAPPCSAAERRPQALLPIALYHMGESHLVYNMMSLLWKGVQLETSVGSLEFAAMTLLLFFDHETAYYYEHAVGFSGVLFALKVVLNSQFSGDLFTYVYGIVVPARYAAWAELVLIQLFVPGVSFLGHLGGVLAGIFYLRLRGLRGGSDPLSSLFGGAAAVLSWPVRFLRQMFRRRPPTGRRGNTVGGAGRPGRGMSGGAWRCPTCTYDNSGWSDVCEMCSTERPGHAFGARRASGHPAGLPVEELRRRRLDRFDR
ncbi:unnamed protein product [Spirodela intermedia]|uniref:RanBP2-type domain-containing protein n=1 Tax=Spirodela intermedia TaxID=51605 RepID=A0A7I8I8L4_SPIIN|nr:unnamed protein product [Spirodela intermedia]CAA6653824.1 unnamed protein product [Spirodela intermedia]